MIVSYTGQGLRRVPRRTSRSRGSTAGSQRTCSAHRSTAGRRRRPRWATAPRPSRSRSAPATPPAPRPASRRPRRRARDVAAGEHHEALPRRLERRRPRAHGHRDAHGRELAVVAEGLVLVDEVRRRLERLDLDVRRDRGRGVGDLDVADRLHELEAVGPHGLGREAPERDRLGPARDVVHAPLARVRDDHRVRVGTPILLVPGSVVPRLEAAPRVRVALACVEINQCVGCMTLPCWLRRARAVKF